MKKQSTLILGILILVLLLGGYFFLSHKNKEENPEAEENITAFETKIDNIKSVSILSGDTKYTFTKDNDTWNMEGMEGYPLDQDKIITMMNRLEQIAADRVLKDPEDVSEFGIDPPQMQILITDKKDKTRSIEFGTINDVTENCYMTVDQDLSKVYLAAPTLVNDFTIEDPLTFVKKENFPEISGNSITKVSIEKPDGSFEIRKNPEDNISWETIDWENNKKKADGSAVSEYMNKVAGLSWVDFVSNKGKDSSLYGLDNPYKITIDYEEKAEESDSEAKESEEKKTEAKKEVLLIGNKTDTEGQYYAKLESQNGIYTISASGIDGIVNVNASDFLGQYVAPYHFADLDTVSIEYNGEIHNYDKKTEEKMEEGKDEPVTSTTYYMDGVQIKIDDFLDFYGKVTEMGFQERLEEKPEITKSPEMTIHFYKEKGIDVTVEYIPYDTNFYIVKDSEGNYSKVNKMTVKEMMKAYDAFLQK